MHLNHINHLNKWGKRTNKLDKQVCNVSQFLKWIKMDMHRRLLLSGEYLLPKSNILIEVHECVWTHPPPQSHTHTTTMHIWVFGLLIWEWPYWCDVPALCNVNPKITRVEISTFVTYSPHLLEWHSCNIITGKCCSSCGSTSLQKTFMSTYLFTTRSNVCNR